MMPRTRRRILGILVVVALLAAIRALSIRRHEADLHAWPSADEPPLRTN